MAYPSKKEYEKTYQDCYDVLVHGEYYGTIKVNNKAGTVEKVNRVKRVIPRLKNAQYGKDYTFKFIGTFPKV